MVSNFKNIVAKKFLFKNYPRMYIAISKHLFVIVIQKSVIWPPRWFQISKILLPKNFYWKITLKSIFTKIFSDGFCQKPFYRFWPPIIGEPVDREKNKNFSVSEIYLASWYKKPFVDISYGLRVIRPTRVGCPKKKATLIFHVLIGTLTLRRTKNVLN